MKRPRVSVCLPTFNRAATLRDTIEAVLKQTYEDWELIVCDDASHDSTREVVAEYRDRRIRYYRNDTNLGLYGNWNRAISLASGEYIGIYHDHDVYADTIVERSVRLLQRFPSASFAHTAVVMVDDDLEPQLLDVRSFPDLTSRRAFRRVLAGHWSSPVMAATAMVRWEAYRAVGPYLPAKYAMGCDKDMWFRLAGIGDVAYEREPQVLIRSRRKGEGTGRFRWPDLLGEIEMRGDEIRDVFPRLSVERAGATARFLVERDLRLLEAGVRAVLLEPTHEVMRAQGLLREEASRVTSAVFSLVCRSSGVQCLLRRYVLPAHYRRIKRREAAARQMAKSYCASRAGLWLGARNTR